MSFRQAREQVISEIVKYQYQGKMDFFRSLRNPFYGLCPYHVRSFAGIQWAKGMKIGEIEHERE